MKKALIRILYILTLMTLQASASGWATGDGSVYHKGDRLGSAGISFFYFGALAAFDYGLHDCISAGAATGYNVHSFAPQTLTHHLPVMARVAFHPFNLDVLSDKIIVRNIIDVYAGLSGGWVFRWDTYDFNFATPPDDHPSSFGVREYIGMRYFFKDNLALFIEDCGYIATISAGVTLTF
jgi:hypothetical protein